MDIARRPWIVSTAWLLIKNYESPLHCLIIIMRSAAGCLAPIFWTFNLPKKCAQSQLSKFAAFINSRFLTMRQGHFQRPLMVRVLKIPDMIMLSSNIVTPQWGIAWYSIQSERACESYIRTQPCLAPDRVWKLVKYSADQVLSKADDANYVWVKSILNKVT